MHCRFESERTRILLRQNERTRILLPVQIETSSWQTNEFSGCARLGLGLPQIHRHTNGRSWTRCCSSCMDDQPRRPNSWPTGTRKPTDLFPRLTYHVCPFFCSPQLHYRARSHPTALVRVNPHCKWVVLEARADLHQCKAEWMEIP